MFDVRSTVSLFLFWPRQAHSIPVCSSVKIWDHSSTRQFTLSCGLKMIRELHLSVALARQGVKLVASWYFFAFLVESPWPMSFRLPCRSTSGNHQQEMLSWILRQMSKHCCGESYIDMFGRCKELVTFLQDATWTAQMLVAESQLQLDPRTRSFLGLDSWLKHPFELHGILKTFPIVRVRSECKVFFRGFGHERRRQGALYACYAPFYETSASSWTMVSSRMQ